MNIIVEGPDNAGKSRLVTRLRGKLHMCAIHNSFCEDVSAVMSKKAAELCKDGNVIYDRSVVISEYIYSRVLARKPVIDANFDTVVNTVANTITIFCLPPAENVLATTKEEMAGVVENLPELYTAYDNMIDELVLHGEQFYVYDWNVDSVEDVVMYIKERMGIENDK